MKNLLYPIRLLVVLVTMMVDYELANAQMTVSGPTTICPQGTYTYSVNNVPFGANRLRWKISYDGVYFVQSGESASSTFSVPFNTYSPGPAYLAVEARNTNIPDALNPIGGTQIPLSINMRLISPVTPNGGTVIFCGSNETVLVTSLPMISQSAETCDFHYAYEWNAPGGWEWTQGNGSGSGGTNYSVVAYPFGYNSLVSPNTVTPGNNGTVKVSALYNNTDWPCCGGPYTVNTFSTAALWVGTPTVSNGTVNNSPSSTPNYVPSGYANLHVDAGGGGNLTWSITNGSGTLSPSGSNCAVSFSGFVRVVVDANNRCGSGGSWTFYLSSTQNYYGYRTAPNPARDKLSLLLETKEVAGEVIQTVELYNEKSKLVAVVGSDQLKGVKSDKSTIDLNVKDLPRGTYFLHVNRKDAIDKQRIVLE